MTLTPTQTPAPSTHGFLWERPGSREPVSPGPLSPEPHFSERYTIKTQAAVSGPSSESHPKISFRAGHDGSHAEFCAGEKFALYRLEMEEIVDFIVARARNLDMPDAGAIEHNLRTTYDLRFSRTYSESSDEIMDSVGKRAYDNIRAMIDAEGLAPERQREVIRNLSLGAAGGALGVIRNLIDVDRDLSLFVGGMRAKQWEVKEEIVREVLREAVVREHSNLTLMGWEIHGLDDDYVDAAWNDLADTVGLCRVPSRYLPENWPKDFLDSCRGRIFAALSPDKIAERLRTDAPPAEIAQIGESDGERHWVSSDGARLAWRLRHSMAVSGPPSPDAHDDVSVIHAADLERVTTFGFTQAVAYLQENLQALLAGIAPAERADWIDKVMHLGSPGRDLARAWYAGPLELLGEERTMPGSSRLMHWIRGNNPQAIEAVCVLLEETWQAEDDPVPFSAIARIFMESSDSMMNVLATEGNPGMVGAVHRLLRALLSGPSTRAHRVASSLPTVFGHRGFLWELFKQKADVMRAMHRMMADPLIRPHMAKVPGSSLLFYHAASAYAGYPMYDLLQAGSAEDIKAYGELLVGIASIPGMAAWLPRLLGPHRYFDEMEISVSRTRSDDLTRRRAPTDMTQDAVAAAIEAYHAILVHDDIFPYVKGRLSMLIPDVYGRRERSWTKAQLDALNRIFDEQEPGYIAYREMLMDSRIRLHLLKDLPFEGNPIRARLVPLSPLRGLGRWLGLYE